MWGRRGAGRSREDQARSSLADLTASRRTIVEAYEVERRRIERDLHDSVQQYLVAATMKLGEAQLSSTLTGDPDLATLISEARSAVQHGLDSLRITVRGIHPQSLTELGLAAALHDVARSSPIPVRMICPHPLPEVPEGVLATAYFFATEALTNIAKHAPEASASVLLTADTHLRVSVVDDGPGGAQIIAGHGLAGMRERLAAFGGSLEVTSPVGGPTQIAAQAPLLLQYGETGIVGSAC
ncbi:Sensor histidine kinase LiaS [Austwickia sp. TVS 96-490-7B]|nr:Sensor histidine kinase LiaS [Austwickia sp. TVS 96-490-7B]